MSGNCTKIWIFKVWFANFECFYESNPQRDEVHRILFSVSTLITLSLLCPPGLTFSSQISLCWGIVEVKPSVSPSHAAYSKA